MLEKEEIEKKINDIFKNIYKSFQTKTDIGANCFEYISALLYLKYFQKDNELFFKIYDKRANFYIADVIDHALEELRFKTNTNLFQNINFKEINVLRNRGEKNILTEVIKQIYDLSAIFENNDLEEKKYVGKAYRDMLGLLVKEDRFYARTLNFYTPFSLTDLMAELIGKDNSEVFDPTCGSGNFLISAAKHFKKGTISGNVNNINIYNICMTNLMLNSCDNKNIKLFNSFKEFTNKELKFDCILSNPPFSQRNWKDKISETDAHFISRFHLLRSSLSDYAYVLAMLNHLKETGKMAIILPQGVLFRINERGVRSELVDYIEAIIELPENLFYNTRIAVIVMILSKNKKSDDILFVDASKDYLSEKNYNVLKESVKNKIVDVFHNRKEEKYFSHLASKEEIKNNDYNLTVKKYVKREINSKIKAEKEDLLKELLNLEKESIILEENINDVMKSLGVSDIFFKNKKDINNTIDYQIISKNIKRIRKEKNYDVENLANDAGISFDFLLRLEKGLVRPSLITLSKICDKLEVSISDILN